MEDNYRHKGLREKMLRELAKLGVSDQNVLQAMNQVPRHFFLDTAFLQFAYNNNAFPIGQGQTISQPYTVGVQTQLLEIKKGHKILEVGTGSGYQTAVLCAMGAKVYTIERHKPLYLKAKKLLNQLGFSPYQTYGDGYKGLLGYAPYDGIIVTCGAPELPKNLLNQLKVGGKLIVPIDAEEGVQEMYRYVKVADNQYKTACYGKFRFVPMLKNRQDG